MIDDGLRVMFADDAPSLLLNGNWGSPRRVNVLGWEVFQLRNESSVSSIIVSNDISEKKRKFRKIHELDVFSVWVVLLTERNRRIDFPVLMEECRGAKPHPVSTVEAPICVQE